MRDIKCPHIFEYSKKLLFDRRLFSFVVLLIVAGVLLVPQPADAFIHGSLVRLIGEGLEAIAGILLSVVLGSILWAFNYIGYLAILFSTLVLKETMSFVLGVSYTPLSADPNSGITIGWTIVRDFANAFFILILVTIGVGTMLGLKVRNKEINASLLMPFFVVALLVNFSPLITGMLIDISNILTKFFFVPAQGGVNAFVSNNPFQPGNLHEFTGTLDTAISQVFGYIIGLIFNLVSSLVLLTMAMLLMARVLALWLLVIFSPLAFAAYILPQTRHYFQMWWSQFLQWTMLPVTLGFFVWLSATFLTNANMCTKTNVGFGGDTQGTAADVIQNVIGGDAFCEITIYGLALGTMVVGMIVSFQSSAIGSQFIIKYSKAGQKLVAGGTARWAERNAYRFGPTIGGAITTVAGKPIAGAARIIGRGAAAIPGVRPVGRFVAPVGRRFVAPVGRIAGRGAIYAGKTVGAPIVGAALGRIQERKMEWKKVKGPGEGYAKWTPQALEGALKWETRGDHREKILDVMRVKHPEYLTKAMSEGGISDKTIRNAEKMAEFYTGGDKFLELAPQKSNNPSKIAEKTSAKIMQNWTDETLADDSVFRGMMKNQNTTVTLLQAIIRNDQKRDAIARGFIGNMRKKGATNFGDFEKELGAMTNNNQRVVSFMMNSPAFVGGLKQLVGKTALQETRMEESVKLSKEKLNIYNKTLDALKQGQGKTGVGQEFSRLAKQIEALSKQISEETSRLEHSEEDLNKYKPTKQPRTSAGAGQVGGEVEDLRKEAKEEVEDLRREFEEYREEQEEKK